MSELMPCPFCGGEAFLCPVEDVDYAECFDCHVYADVKHWNTRATPAPSPSREGWTAPHMCRDGHQEIHHFDSENEQCPLCMALSALRPAGDEGLGALLQAWVDWYAQGSGPQFKTPPYSQSIAALHTAPATKEGA